jgi:hypothetical protein
MFVESVNSPIIVFITPTLPSSAPHMQRLEKRVRIACHIRSAEDIYLMARLQKVVERPKQSTETQAPDTPNNNTGFRPMRSDSRLHLNRDSACVRKRRDSCRSHPIASTGSHYGSSRWRLRSFQHNTLQLRRHLQ